MPKLASCIVLLAVALTPATAPAVPVVFDWLNNDGPNEGFNDLALGAARTSAFEYALGIYGNVFESRFAGETVTVRAEFEPLDSFGPLASASPDLLWTMVNNEPVSGVAYPSALASHRHLRDVNGASHEIAITFNAGANWYYGTNAMPGSQIDLVTVALHELGHGLGFTGFLQQNGSYFGGNVSIFDHFMNGSETGGVKLTTLTEAEREAEVKGNDLYWDGAEAAAANGGARPKLHAPGTFNPGSSLYHLSESPPLTNELMSPVYSGADHTLSPLELGMYKDMGWTLVAIPEAGAWLFGVVASGVSGAVVVIQRCRQASAAILVS